jgi:hypothetical protein
MKTNELTGKALNWAVGKAEGLDGWLAPVNYCGKWEHGGPIIERERIATGFDGYDDIDSALPIWSACKYVDGFERYGPTPLIAAMRYYVASKLGDDVDVPEELV